MIVSVRLNHLWPSGNWEKQWHENSLAAVLSFRATINIILVYMKVRMLDFISLLVQYFARGFKDLEAANLCFPAQ